MNFSRLERIVKDVFGLLNLKRIDEKSINWHNVYASRKDIVFFTLSSNPIILLKVDGRTFYFRECFPVTNTKEYFLRWTENFFEYISNNDFQKMNFTQEIPIKTQYDEKVVIQFRKYILTKLCNKNFIKKLSSMDRLLVEEGFSIWEDNPCFDTRLLSKCGFNDLLPEHVDIAFYFIWYIRSAAKNRRVYKRVRGTHYSFYNAVRSISTWKLAEIFGLESMITKTDFCCLHIDNRVFHGVLSESAPGVRACDIQVAPSPYLRSELLKLNIFDIVCMQKDHSSNNYNIYVDDFGRQTICAFDNDNPNTFFPIPSICTILSDGAVLFTKDGRIQSNYLDSELFNRLIHCNYRVLHVRLRPYLNWMQVQCVIVRIQKINRLLQQAVQNKTLKLLHDE